jgi:hypothetical protein
MTDDLDDLESFANIRIGDRIDNGRNGSSGKRRVAWRNNLIKAHRHLESALVRQKRRTTAPITLAAIKF